MYDNDVRALILGDMYGRKKKGQNVLTAPNQYAALIGITPEIASLNLQYLIESGFARGTVDYVSGTTVPIVFVYDITRRGIDVVEGRDRRPNNNINYNIINVFGDISGQIAMGRDIAQTQNITLNFNSFQDVYRYAEENLSSEQNDALRPLLKELEKQFTNQCINPSTLKQIHDLLVAHGPRAVAILQPLLKLLFGFVTGQHVA